MFAVPAWLYNWLIYLNWDIFTWHVDVGGPILTVIYWLLGIINDVYSEANRALNSVGAAYQSALDLVTAVTANFAQWTQIIWNVIALWPSQLAAWWDGTRSQVFDWISVAVDQALAEVQRFLSVDIFLAWWGHVGTTFDSWWDAARMDVLSAVDTIVAPVRDTVNEHAGAIELLTSPGDTALRWLWDRITTAIVRLW